MFTQHYLGGDKHVFVSKHAPLDWSDVEILNTPQSGCPIWDGIVRLSCVWCNLCKQKSLLSLSGSSLIFSVFGLSEVVTV